MFRREARGQRLGAIRRNVFPLASCPSPLAWLLFGFATNPRELCGLVSQSASGIRKKRHWPSTIPADRFVQKHTAQTAKSVQLYAPSMHIPHLDIEQGWNCPHKNTVTARYPTAFRLRRRYLVKDPQRADFRNVLAQNVLCPYILLRP